MRIDWWTLGLQTINLLVLVWILSRFLFRPIADIIAQRQADAKRVLADAEKVRQEAEEAEQAAERASAQAAASRRDMIEAATAEAAEAKRKLAEDARKEADRLREQALAEIDRMRETEATRNEARASRLAVDIAGRLFARLPDEARISGFIDGLAQGLEDLPPAAREELGGADEPITLKAPRELTSAEDEAVSKTLSGVLGHGVTLRTEVEPDLIAGLEIETAHAAIRNSFRNDLDRITAELTRDEPDRS